MKYILAELVIEGKLYLLEVRLYGNAIIVNVYENNKFNEIKVIKTNFDLTKEIFVKYGVFVKNDKIYCIVHCGNYKRFNTKYKIYSINIKTLDFILEYVIYNDSGDLIHEKNYFIRKENPHTLSCLNADGWWFRDFYFPYEIDFTQHKILLVFDDYIIINCKDSSYRANKDSLSEIKKLDIDIKKLYIKKVYQNYILYNKNNYVHIFNIKTCEINKICPIYEDTIIFYNFKLLSFNYEEFVKHINIKTHPMINFII